MQIYPVKELCCLVSTYSALNIGGWLRSLSESHPLNDMSRFSLEDTQLILQRSKFHESNGIHFCLSAIQHGSLILKLCNKLSHHNCIRFTVACRNGQEITYQVHKYIYKNIYTSDSNILPCSFWLSSCRQWCSHFSKQYTENRFHEQIISAVNQTKLWMQSESKRGY